MIHATINGVAVEAAEGTTILDAARAAQIRIPTLCKHPDLSASAGCGICVVRVGGGSNLQRACCTPLAEGMVVTTHDPEIVAVRRTTLKLILSDHPNECLTCARNGCCELQDLAAEFGIRHGTFESLVRDLPRDKSTGSIELDPRKCVKCGRCIEVCQQRQDVWALSFLERGLGTRISPAGDIDLAESPCIRCGQCSAHCPTGAIVEHNQAEQVWDMLMDPTLHCIAQIAPAVRVSVGEHFGFPPGANLTGALYAALRRLGFKTVFDTNFGADVTIVEEASEFVRRLGEGAGPLPLITTCCPSWVDFMEKFHPDMIEHFSSCKSPHAILGVLAKTYYAEQNGIPVESIRMVSFMPCTSKKYEIRRTEEMYASGAQDVDISLTTREFVRMVRQAGIELGSLPPARADTPLGEYSGAGTIFGASGGVAEAALRSAQFYLTGEDGPTLEFEAIQGSCGVKEMETTVAGRPVRVAVAHGLGNVEQVLDKVREAKAAGDGPAYHLIEVMACPGGCVGGGGQSWGVTEEIRQQRTAALRADDRDQPVRLSHRNPSVVKIYEDFLGDPLGERAHNLLHTSYTPREEYKR